MYGGNTHIPAVYQKAENSHRNMILYETSNFLYKLKPHGVPKLNEG